MSVARAGSLSDFLYRFRRDPIAVVSAVVVAFLVLSAVLAPILGRKGTLGQRDLPASTEK